MSEKWQAAVTEATYTLGTNCFRQDDVVIFSGGKVALTIKADGQVVIGDGLQPDEAGRRAAESLANAFPAIVYSAIAAEREACAILAEMYQDVARDTEFDTGVLHARDGIAKVVRSRRNTA